MSEHAIDRILPGVSSYMKLEHRTPKRIVGLQLLVNIDLMCHNSLVEARYHTRSLPSLRTKPGRNHEKRGIYSGITKRTMQTQILTTCPSQQTRAVSGQIPIGNPNLSYYVHVSLSVVLFDLVGSISTESPSIFETRLPPLESHTYPLCKSKENTAGLETQVFVWHH